MIKLYGFGGRYGEKQKYILVLMCKDHEQLAKKRNNPRALYVCCILILSIFLLTRFLSELINNTIILTSLFGILAGGGALIFSYILYKDMYIHSDFEDYIVLQCSKTDYSIISIRRSDWAEEFERLNECIEDKLDLELVKEIRRKYHKNLKNFVIVISSLMIFLVISVIIQITIIILPLTLMLVIFTLYFGGNQIKYHHMIYKINARDYGI